MAPLAGARMCDEAAVVKVMQGRTAALASMLNLKEDQKPAFDAFMEASTQWMASRHEGWDPSKVYDEQTRLEHRAQRMKERSEKLADVAAKRAALWKVLDPQQKLVLENYGMHRGYGQPGLKFHDNHPYPACGCPQGRNAPPAGHRGPGGPHHS